jgi:ribonuclease PH
MQRFDNRRADDLRKVVLMPSWSRHAEGSCLIEIGDTKVLCTASVEEKVPPWMRGGGKGWVTAEYGMLPRSTHSRKARDGSRPKPDGRGVEIQRLIGRSLRAVVDMEILGERQITIDCDVLQADGGTRCAAITGGWVALQHAVFGLMEKGLIQQSPIRQNVAAISVGLINNQAVLDLPYEEDSSAEVDMNVVMDGNAQLIEVQATGETRTFSRDEMNALLDLAEKGIGELVAFQNSVIRP